MIYQVTFWMKHPVYGYIDYSYLVDATDSLEAMEQAKAQIRETEYWDEAILDHIETKETEWKAA